MDRIHVSFWSFPLTYHSSNLTSLTFLKGLELCLRLSWVLMKSLTVRTIDQKLVELKVIIIIYSEWNLLKFILFNFCSHWNLMAAGTLKGGGASTNLRLLVQLSGPRSSNPISQLRGPSKQIGDVFNCTWGVFVNRVCMCIRFESLFNRWEIPTV